jgi:mannitol-specific phosphotransferase system IIBC component
MPILEYIVDNPKSIAFIAMGGIGGSLLEYIVDNPKSIAFIAMGGIVGSFYYSMACEGIHEGRAPARYIALAIGIPQVLIVACLLQRFSVIAPASAWTFVIAFLASLGILDGFVLWGEWGERREATRQHKQDAEQSLGGDSESRDEDGAPQG